MSKDIRARARSHLTETEAQQVIARALELDATRADGVSVAGLEQVAHELGISPESMSQAVAELESAGPSTVSAVTTKLDRSHLSPASVTTLIAAAAFLLGVVQGHKVEQTNFYLLIATAAVAVMYRTAREPHAYLRHVGALWAGFGLGWFIASGMANEGDTAFHLVVPGLTAMAIGWLILKVRRRHIAHLASLADLPSTPRAD